MKNQGFTGALIALALGTVCTDGSNAATEGEPPMIEHEQEGRATTAVGVGAGTATFELARDGRPRATIVLANQFDRGIWQYMEAGRREWLARAGNGAGG